MVYSKALFEAALEEKQVERVKEDYDAMMDLIQTYPDYLRMLDSPVVETREKMEMLQQIGWEGLYRNFLFILLEKQRMREITSIKTEFDALYDQYLGIQKARVTTAVSLSEQQVETLEKNLSNATGKQVMVEQIIDPSLIAGIQIKMGDTVLDRSIQKSLVEMREKMVLTEENQ